jgi:hypothetical protein
MRTLLTTVAVLLVLTGLVRAWGASVRFDNGSAIPHAGEAVYRVR